MFDIFPDQPSYEYPPLINVIYTLVWSFLLSSIVAITHRLTYRGDSYSTNFFQSMVLGSIITAMIMMAIGDSLARGLGVFGAMAIIRFRTRIDDPRDVLFLFAALSTGIAMGVYGYSTAFAGAMVFCLAAVVLHFSRFRSHNPANSLFFTLEDTEKLTQLMDIVRQYCKENGLVNVSITGKNRTRYEYFIVMTNSAEKDKLLQEMNKVEGVNQLMISRTRENNY